MKTILKITGVALIALTIGLVAFVHLSWEKEYESPLPDFAASTDSVVISRGKYLAFGPAHCATCHVPMDKVAEVEGGLEIPLSGGWELPIPPGTFRAPNLTPDLETGIGNMSDAQLARAMRYNVKRDNTCLFPFMPFNGLSDEDIVAVISFIRSQPPVKHEVPKTELTFMGKALMAFGLIKPEFPAQTPPKSLVKEPTAEYGKYLAYNVANCYGCHTNRDMQTGAFIGEPFAGGMYFPPDVFSEGFSYVAPNLTPDAETGIMARWSEENFVSRFKAGRVHNGSPMPWGAFFRMDTTDLRALYQFLHSVKAVKYPIDQIVFAPGEKPKAK